LLALIVLVYMLYNFFIMLTASGQDEKYKKWVEGIKTAFLVIIGIGISWLVVSFIFYLVKIFTTW
jgi:NADH:ubiquinone oxidoreductase subunit 6 (subunit J)